MLQGVCVCVCVCMCVRVCVYGNWHFYIQRSSIPNCQKVLKSPHNTYVLLYIRITLSTIPPSLHSLITCKHIQSWGKWLTSLSFSSSSARHIASSGFTCGEPRVGASSTQYRSHTTQGGKNKRFTFKYNRKLLLWLDSSSLHPISCDVNMLHLCVTIKFCFCE